MIYSKHTIKKLSTLILMLFLSNCIFISCSTEDDSTSTIEEIDTPLEAAIFTDVSYGDHPQQVYDLYLPAGRSNSKTKVIIVVHGGGWIEGDKSDTVAFVDFLQNQHPDHAIVNTNYVLADINTPAFPNQFLDIQRVINKLKSEQESLQILPEFGLLGASAGAHISLMYDAIYDTDDEVKFVIDIVGPSDFTDPFYSNNPNFDILLNILVDTSAYPPNTDYASAVSPALQINATTSPTLLFYGDQDELVPLSNGETLANSLQSNGIDHIFTVYNGGHGNDWSEADLLDLQLKSNNYINTYLQIEN